jgi:beta-lactamase regulating signal transducer with metallopeptidase domain
MRSVESAVLAFLLNGTWQIALVAVAAAVASRMLRRFPALPRHAVWVAALGIALLLPAAQQLMRRYMAANESLPRTIVYPTAQRLSVSRTSMAGGTGELVRIIPGNTKASAPVHSKPKRNLAVGGGIAAAIVAIYAVLILWRMTALARAWNRARLLARRARFVSLDARLREVTEACGAAFDGAKASLFSSSEIAAPATVGWLWPRILLPESLVREGNVDSLTAAIGHEMAHIARRDYLLNLICEFCYVPLAFQPAAAIVSRQIRRTRELRCDELVAERLMEPKTYARALVEMARAATKCNSLLTVAVGMSDGDILEERILSTLRRQNMKVQGKRSLLGIAAVVLIAPCAIAMPFALRVEIKDPALEARSGKRPDALRFTNTAQKDLAPTGALASGGASSKFAKPVSDSERAGARQAPVQSSKELRDRIDREVSTETQMQTMIEQLRAKIEKDIQDQVSADEDRKKLSAAENQLVQMEQASENAAMKQKLERAIAEAREKVRQDERKGTNAEIDRKRLSELERQMQGTGWQRLESEASVQAMQRMAEELQAKIQHDQQTGANTESEQRQLLELKQKLEAVQKGGMEGEHGWAISNEGQNVEEVRQKLERLTEQLEKARQTESPDHPEVRQLEEQIAALKSRVEIETMNSWREREEAMRQRQIELASKAKISMPDAIQIALQSHQGTVMQCVLRGERDMIFYNVGIFGDATFTVKDGNGNSSTKTVKTVMTVLVDAIDGHVIKTEGGQM